MFLNMSILEIGLDLVGGLTKQLNGIKYKSLCPLHEEKHPSFFIIPTKNRFVCYGCNRGGGPITLVFELFSSEKP